MIAILSKSVLFRNISDAEISELLETAVYRVIAYRSKDIVALQGAPCNHLMIVLSGLLQGQMVNDAGKLVVIEELRASQLLAPAFLYAPKNNLPVNILAMEPSEILFIHRDDFTQWMQLNKQLLQNFLMLISGRSHFLSDKIMFLSLKNIKNKIADYLLRKLPEPTVDVIHLTETQQEIADSFGVTRPSLARALAEMEQEGVISIDRKIIKVRNMPALKQMAQ
ncbi:MULTISPECIES: Crp/Fnr family transcriptional regulator [Parabacteroides]|uniref:Crp/Fnr family transcriptional regulator n=1 Tax=Parabacteroides leei TaxID=2939491 RepID=UPI0018987D95|nr:MULTISPECIES: Crp/Fnr family transcriptional regulator [Parabacteroides]MCL3853991.1 Crp/Fnr family transcriptional regulator [Parabacteroides leei]